MRKEKRLNSSIRSVSLEPNLIPNALGSCLVKFGNTHVICTASLDEYVPYFIKNTGTGWLSAEYSMLPGATEKRTKREALNGKQNSRTVEIQRLIGRSLRAPLDLKKLGERQILVDCDVINADGGTRTASITGAFVAISLAISVLIKNGILKKDPIKHQIAAISAGIRNNEILIDLDYNEDSSADIDANFVFASSEHLVEIQASAEKGTFLQAQLNEMIEMSLQTCKELFILQKKALENTDLLILN